MKTIVKTCTLAAVLALGTSAGVYASETIDFAGNKFVVSDKPPSKATGERFEFAGNNYTLADRKEVDSDLNALESVDSLDSMIWGEDDPAIVLTGE